MRIDPNRIPFLYIAYKQMKLIQANIRKFLQFTWVNLGGLRAFICKERVT